jgi:hypothetical protein
MVEAVALCDHEANAPVIASNHSPEITNFTFAPNPLSATVESNSPRSAFPRSAHSLLVLVLAPLHVGDAPRPI